MSEPSQSPLQSKPEGLSLWEGSSVFVKQGRHWSSALIWLSASLFGAAVIWAFVARIDQTISVRGVLQPAKSVKDIQSPSNGVVLKVLVSDGDQVKAGDPLITVEAKGLASRRKAIEESLKLFGLEANALQTIIASGGDPNRFTPLPPLPPVADPKLSATMEAARDQTQQFRSQLQQLSIRIASRNQSLKLQQRLADDIRPLYENGGIARNNYLTQLNNVQELKAEIASLQGEKSKIVGTVTGQLNEINRQEITLRSQLASVREELGYRTIQAPVSGTVFDLKAAPYAVVANSQELLKIVPRGQLLANVEIPNSDIGFVRVGQVVSVAVDSFPSGEFGYIKGSLASIGSDSLPPDQDSPRVYFPATVTLDQQIVEAGTQKLNLQSGMGVTANIKLRSRPAITILTDIFTRQLEGVKRFR